MLPTFFFTICNCLGTFCVGSLENHTGLTSFASAPRDQLFSPVSPPDESTELNVSLRWSQAEQTIPAAQTLADECHSQNALTWTQADECCSNNPLTWTEADGMSLWPPLDKNTSSWHEHKLMHVTVTTPWHQHQSMNVSLRIPWYQRNPWHEHKLMNVTLTTPWHEHKLMERHFDNPLTRTLALDINTSWWTSLWQPLDMNRSWWNVTLTTPRQEH